MTVSVLTVGAWLSIRLMVVRQGHSGLDIVIRKLENYTSLDRAAKVALEDLFATVTIYQEGDVVFPKGTPAKCYAALLQGHICRALDFDDGVRQIVSLSIPGDTLEIQGPLLPTLDHSVTALTRCKLALASTNAVEALTKKHPSLAFLLRRNVNIEASVSRQWVASLGRRTAYGRLAHLLCELFVRNADAGLNERASFNMPLKQTELSDICGLSYVHMNRVIRELHKKKRAEIRNRRCTILDWPGLVQDADFDPAYLYLNEEFSPPKAT